LECSICRLSNGVPCDLKARDRNGVFQLFSCYQEWNSGDIDISLSQIRYGCLPGGVELIGRAIDITGTMMRFYHGDMIPDHRKCIPRGRTRDLEHSNGIRPGRVPKVQIAG